MSLSERARAWIAADPDPDTRRELRTLLDANDEVEIAARFAGRLEFGTAGLRGLLGAGPARMNQLTVAQATAGLCAWLDAKVPNAKQRGICLGRDAREKSDLFEREATEVATAAGFVVLRFAETVPTPVVAFSVLERNAAAGVVITASHNPPGYNGYKVFWQNGAQIVPPNDSGIAQCIEHASRGDIAHLSVDEARADGLVVEIDASREDYVARITSEVPDQAGRSPIRIAYTALHGVAEATMRTCFERAGFDDVASVHAQAKPDSRFPTVAFPNPEEPGAMAAVLRLGEEIEADLVIAHDPDGDRVAAAARGRDGFEILSGNEIGLLLADELLRNAQAEQPLVLSTIVSSPQLGPIAASHGARWEQTLTGHKWIQNRALELRDEGYTYVFGYEEALGYACSPAVRDKDGISAALRLANMAAHAKTEGGTLIDRRDALFERHGVALDRQVSVRFEGPNAASAMKSAVDRLRTEPPKRIGGTRVTSSRDLWSQTIQTDGIESTDASLRRSDVLIFGLEDGSSVMVRPSGTEPKLKYYFYATKPMREEGLEASKSEARATLDRMVADLTPASDC